VGPNLAQKIAKTSVKPESFLKNKITDSFFLAPVTEDEIIKTFTNLKNGAAGWDGFRADIIKKVKHIIAPSITHICNLSFSLGYVPREMKLANVVPIFKAGDNMTFTNYRPVSVLPLVSKVLERVMYTRLLNFLNKHKILYEYQFGFRNCYSTYMALITLVDRISNALDKGESVVGIFLDFSKAFDTVDHDILLNKLQHYGIRGNAHDWFKSYLIGREQYVTFSGTKSDTTKVKCGVPQGSILGPLLFLIYINDLYHIAHNSFPLLFADDTNLFFTGKNNDVLTNTVNNELAIITGWLESNKLSLNIKKTNYMLFTFRSRNKNASDLDIKIKSNSVERVYMSKFLGIMIDCHLLWDSHIKHINTKLSKTVGILAKARRYLPKECLKDLYYTFAYPYLIYCNHVWGNTHKTYLDKIIKTQKKLIRIISGSHYRAHTSDLFANNKLLNMQQIYQYSIGIFMFKYCNDELPNLFANMFQKNSGIHTHNTRQQNHFHLPKFKNNMLKNSVRYQGVTLWNGLPDQLRESKSLNSFKFNFKKSLLN